MMVPESMNTSFPAGSAELQRVVVKGGADEPRLIERAMRLSESLGLKCTPAAGWRRAV